MTKKDVDSAFSLRLKTIEKIQAQTIPALVDEDWIQDLIGHTHIRLRSSSIDKINAPNLELLGRGGKRWRPLVLVLAYEIEGGADDLAYQLSPLVELPHNGSLIVDDIEDKSDERRGGPAIHLLYGIDMAINSGNFLYFLPSYLLEKIDLSVEKRATLSKYYLRVMRRLHFGQGLDIQWHNDHDYIPEIGEYLQMCRFKTGSLSRLSAEIGVAAAGAPQARIEAMGSVWEDIGVGFQIMDDVFNLTTGNPGKMRGDDIVEGKKSLPVILHCAKSADKGLALMDLFKRVSAAPKTDQPPLILEAISLMEGSGSILAAREKAESLLEDSRRRLASFYPEDKSQESLALLDGLVESFLTTFKSK